MCPLVLQITSKIAVLFITVQYNVTLSANGKSRVTVSGCLVKCVLSCRWIIAQLLEFFACVSYLCKKGDSQYITVLFFYLFFFIPAFNSKTPYSLSFLLFFFFLFPVGYFIYFRLREILDSLRRHLGSLTVFHTRLNTFHMTIKMIEHSSVAAFHLTAAF